MYAYIYTFKFIILIVHLYGVHHNLIHVWNDQMRVLSISIALNIKKFG
jgi:hypothetical protein